MAMKIPALSELPEIISIDKDALNQAFSSNLEMICRYSNANITTILELRTSQVLIALREAQMAELIKILPTYASRQSKKPQDKSRIIEDIIALSRSIIAAKPDPDLDDVFKNGEPIVVPTTVKALFEYVNKELNSTNSRVSKLEAENRMLREIIQSEGIDLNAHSSLNVSDTSDLTDECETSDTDCESDSSFVSQNKTPRKTPKRSTFKGKPKCFEGIPKKTFVFVRNATEETTSKEVFKHMKKNSKVKVATTDIQEMKTNGKSKAFKIAVDEYKMQDLINKTKWPKHVTVEAFNPLKRKPRQTSRNQRKSKNMTNNRNQKFQKERGFRRNHYTPRERAYRPHQQNTGNHYIPRERTYTPHQQNTGNQFRNEHPPGGYNPWYSRDFRY